MQALSSPLASFLIIRGLSLSIEFDRNISVGERLRSARERAKLSIDMVADQSRLSRRYIMAIEQNRLDLIPGDVYVRNFCKIYGKYVGLSENEIDYVLKNINRTLQVYEPRELEISNYFKIDRVVFSGMRVILAIIILIMILVLFMLNL